MHVHKEHRIECSAERFWELAFDPEFQRQMNLEAMSAEKYDVLETNAGGETWKLRSRMTPKDDMPGFIKKLVGGGFSMEEEAIRQKGADRSVSTMTPSSLRDKVRMKYEMRVVPEGEGACRRILDWDVEVKIFGIGGQIEKFIAGQIDKGMEQSARYLNTHAK